jgi:hypothetical protein
MSFGSDTGSFPTFPYTPGFSFVQRHAYRTSVVGFDDRSEQRFLEAEERELLLTYVFDYVNSATAAGINSWFAGAAGPYWRFLVANHNEVSPAGVPAYYIARFADNNLEQRLIAGGLHQIEPITFAAARTEAGIGWGGEGEWGWDEGGWGGR